MARGPGWRRWLVAVLATAALAGCAGPGDDAPHSGDSVITAALITPPGAEAGSAWRSDMSRQLERQEMVARTSAEWGELWRRSGHAAPRSLPGDRMAVAVFLGSRVSGGYAIAIDPTKTRQDENGALLVGYHEQVPGPEAVVAQGQTAPFTVVLLPLESRSVRFARLP